MKNFPTLLRITTACAVAALTVSGCSLFHHHEKKPKPWHPKPLGPGGPMQGDPQPMVMKPMEPNPRPLAPVQMEQQDQ